MPKQDDAVYTALPKNTIRTLELTPGQASDPLRCTFTIRPVTTSFKSELRPYIALSYVWGKADFPHTISCSIAFHEHSTDLAESPLLEQKQTSVKNSSVPITQNLYDALIHLRRPHATQNLWIDALSINQRDLEEKATQIPLMGQIYREALQVIVWLGLCDPSTTIALKVINAAASQMQQECGSLLPASEHIKHQDLTDHDLRVMNLPLSTDEHSWRSFVQFLRNPWFNRIWILQEAFFARDGVVQLGDHMFPLNHLVAAIRWFDRKCIGTERRRILTNFQRIRWDIYAMSKRKPMEKYYSTCFSLLSICDQMEATDPRDIFYALLGLMEEKLRNSVKVDYKKPVPVVYAEAIKSFMQMGPFAETFDFFDCVCTAHHSSPEFPSWVPHLNTPFFMTKCRNHRLPYLDHCAGGEVILVPPSDPSIPLVLSVHGFVFAEIDEVKTFDKDTPQEWGDIPVKLSLYRSILSKHRSLIEREMVASFDNILASTITGGLRSLETGCPYTSSDLKEYMIWSGNIPEVQEYARERYGVIQMLPEEWLSETPTPHMETCGDFHSAVEAVLREHTLCTTVSGGLFLGPSSMKQDDIICIIFGYHSPIVLTAAANRQFRLVGSGYMDGIMHGEAVEEGRKRGQIFQLV